MAPLRFQLNIFFVVSITAMTLKLVSMVIANLISFNNSEGGAGHRTDTNINLYLFLGILNFLSDLSFSGLIFSYLMTSAAREREMRASILIDE